MLAACSSDYSQQLEGLQTQLDEYRQQCRQLEDNAAALKQLLDAVQAADALQSFEPIAEDGEIVGFKAVFKDAGEVILYNETNSIAVGQDAGKYYWMAGGEYLRDADGNRIEISPQSTLPQFRVSGGHLEVSVDGSKSFSPLGDVDKCLITSVSEDASQVVFTLAGGAEIIVPKYQALTLSLSGDNRKIGAGETVEVSYRIEGAENATLKLVCGSGWTALVTAVSATEGTIAITAPSPIAEDKVIALLSDGSGRMTAVELQLVADTSTNPEQPTPPEEPILRPAKASYNVAAEGGYIMADLFTNLDYKVETSAGWLKFAGTKAVRTDKLVFVAEPNTSGERTATATISSGIYSTQIAFVQESVQWYLRVFPDNLSFDCYDGEQTLTVTSNAEYTCIVSHGWVSLSGASSGNTGRYTVTVSENPAFEPRTATITFASQQAGSRTVTITQEAQEPYLELSESSLTLSAESGYKTITVWSNVDYTVSQPTQSWLRLSGTAAIGRQYFTITVDENPDYTDRTASITFSGQDVPSQTLTVTQAGRKAVIPRAALGDNLYTAPSGAHYRYGPSIILNDDGSIDVWTSKEGGRYIDCTADYLCQENTTRSKVPAAGHVIAQYFNVQHRFMRVMVNIYGAGTTADAVTLRLYKWAGNYAATVAGSPISTLVINNTDQVSAGGTRYSIYRDSGHSWLEAGEYLWTATDASSGVGFYKYSGDGTIYLTDSKSYLDGSAVSGYNFQARLRGSAYNSNSYADSFAYFHSGDGAQSWTKERDVMFGTEGSEDSWSICDPGVSHFGGWYYIGYTSAKGEPGVFNHCYLARSRSPQGPWYKWNGSGWGGEPVKVVEFTGDSSHWGIGEPSIVVKDNTIYLYHSYVTGEHRETRVLTAPVGENWPAQLVAHGTAFDQSGLSGSDSADVKYVEDYGLFYAFHTYNRMTSLSKIAVWTSTDGLNFIYQGDMKGEFMGGMHNMGVSGDDQGHIRLSRQQYVAYAFTGNGSWGNWNTRFAPMYFE